ncbi:uncharacterized protein LOC121859583 [Homarus americanus]|uniref:uncharacterized protein LOC121859583 n=1 Tax=Homarus americanus TaxID=6706 RepID=UPI001C49690C|nr:uncharacterized protein LOC121859583 [Homarus americanus]
MGIQTLHPDVPKGHHQHGSGVHEVRLRLPLGESHFKEGQVRLTCSASFRNFYNQSSDIMLNRLGFKTVAPSQKLYGTGSTMEVNVVMLVLAFMVTASLLVM